MSKGRLAFVLFVLAAALAAGISAWLPRHLEDAWKISPEVALIISAVTSTLVGAAFSTLLLFILYRIPGLRRAFIGDYKIHGLWVQRLHNKYETPVSVVSIDYCPSDDSLTIHGISYNNYGEIVYLWRSSPDKINFDGKRLSAFGQSINAVEKKSSIEWYLEVDFVGHSGLKFGSGYFVDLTIDKKLHSINSKSASDELADQNSPNFHFAITFERYGVSDYIALYPGLGSGMAAFARFLLGRHTSLSAEEAQQIRHREAEKLGRRNIKH